jgi:regulator of protease activity HflC (stomatin/prohibitin superfamily)
MSVIANDFHNAVAALEAEGHALAAHFRSIFDHLFGDVPALEAEAKTDVAEIKADAEKAAAPVVAEAVHDGEQLVADAAADAKAALNPAPAQVPDPTAVTPTA